MSWLLFMDESGHDHKNLPYEVRGGIALSADRLWQFVQAVKALEDSCFGAPLHAFKSEIKGCKLLDKDRFKWAAQDAPMDAASRRQNAFAFLNRAPAQQQPTRAEFTGFGQACLAMARGIFDLLDHYDAKLLATAIPRSVAKPHAPDSDDYLRRDHCYLLERFFYFLESVKKPGLLVLDETEKTADRRFVRQLERYFTLTRVGRHRTTWIVPSPFFVSSDMAYPVQVADVCIYCVNFGYRIPGKGMNASTRPEIEAEFRDRLDRLQFHGDGFRDGQVFRLHGITYVPNPYGHFSA